jgi:hypothetical protein
LEFVISGIDFSRFLAWQSPGELALLSSVIAIGIFVVSASALVMPFGAMSSGSAWSAAIATCSTVLKFFPQCMLICLLLGCLNVCVGSPSLLANSGPGMPLVGPDEVFIENSLLWIWQALASLLVLPASLLPFCELWKVSARGKS